METAITAQNTGEGEVFLFEGPEVDRASGKEDAIALTDYPAFRMATWNVGTDPLWAWCDHIPSVLVVSW